MSAANPLSRARLRSIFHPTDLSAGSEVAFVHALRIALITGAQLNILHVAPRREVTHGDFPGVRATLERWGLLPPGSPTSAVERLGIGVRKSVVDSRSPVEASLEFLERHPADFIVLAVHQYEGRMAWLEERVGEPIARGAGEMTLFIPHGVPGFVSPATGAISLRNVIVPVAWEPSAQPAAEAAMLLIENLGVSSGTLNTLHAGSGNGAPSVKVPSQPGWDVHDLVTDGEPSEVIVKTAEDTAADLVVMTSEGPRGFLDALRGSTLQRVLRRVRCPVMSLSSDQWMSRVRQFWAQPTPPHP
ncbi:MAG TPA: universal stress protein [Steroidobacteraceae bacterium]|jgi:nucleotide-binding universal stress UspA family protein|nr:universal stress protein [Steroidobacteraceae bacterium]